MTKDLTRIERIAAWEQVHGPLSSQTTFRLMKLTDEAFDEALEELREMG